MKWLRYLSALLCVVCLSCASDGGPVGTGISSTSASISGNVVDVQTTTATAARASTLPSIRVSLDGIPDATTTADSGGNFVLTGNFAGMVTMRFTVPQFQVTQQLDVPAGSAIVLQDIELQPGTVIAQAARQLDFVGTVDLVDCTDGTLLIREQRSEGRQFLVHLDNQTSFVDAAGDAETCENIQDNEAVAVEGSIAYATDRTITALVVTIAPPPPPPPQGQLEARFAGAIAALDCAAGFVVVDDSDNRTDVQVTAQTQLTGGSGALSCQDLHLGDAVQGQGQINLRMPGVIVATRLEVTGAPHSGQSLRFVGFVTAIDCTSGALQLRDDGTAIDVQLSAATVITRRNGQMLTCADIQPGDRADGVGQLAAEGSGTLEAVQMRVSLRGSGGSQD
jgi:uncharacterized protein DUF5666